MRKITAKRTHEKKQKRNQKIGTVVLIIILLSSIIGYAISGSVSKKNKIYYKGYEFVEENGFWFVEKEGMRFSFRYNPNDVGEIAENSVVNLLDSYFSKPIYISSEDIESESEIYRNLLGQNNIVQRMQLACLEGEACDNEELPIKTCGENFIIIREAEISSIKQENHCVFIGGKSENLAKITDSFLLKIIGL